jgi:homoserine kinase
MHNFFTLTMRISGCSCLRIHLRLCSSMSHTINSTSQPLASQPQRVTVRLPGSSTNCGAGFDCLAVALSLYNRVTVGRLPPSDAPPSSPAGDCSWSALPERDCDAAAQDMALAAAHAFGNATNICGYSFSFVVDGDVPPARGIGSSVTVIGGVLAALNVLEASPLSRHQLVALAAQIEGHADNAAACLLGGFCVARCEPITNAYIDTIRICVPNTLRFIVASPAVQLLTKESRCCLPSSLPYAHAVSSISSCAYVVAAFATGDYHRLRGSVSDFMHEPYRLPMIPGGSEAIAAGIAAGAYAGWLSGSGSSVLCVCEVAAAERVTTCMRAAFSEKGVLCNVRDLDADNEGYVIEDSALAS